MIESRKDLKYFISADRARQPIKHPFLSAISYSESYLLRHYLSVLRHYEYYLNKSRLVLKCGHLARIAHCGLFLMRAFYFIRWRRLCLKTGIQVYPNTCGPGLAITHHSYVHIDNLTTIGKNCSILPMVLFGKNKGGRIEVGDNVHFGCGVTVLAPCKIGNNVFIGAGAVVTKDIPDNCTVGGVPARIISRIENNN